MATLPDADRRRVWAGIMRWWSRHQEELGAFSKAELRAAVDATDQFIEDNQVAYNAALPQPFRGEATLEQKTLLFCAVAAIRVSIAFLRNLFGEVD